VTITPDIAAYYRDKAVHLRRKAEAMTNRTARGWLIEGADECELRAIQAELAVQQNTRSTNPGLSPGFP
jgi:hypothetical protein